MIAGYPSFRKPPDDDVHHGWEVFPADLWRPQKKVWAGEFAGRRYATYPKTSQGLDLGLSILWLFSRWMVGWIDT